LDYKIDRSNTITATGEYVWMQNTATGVPLPWSPPPGIWLSWSRKFDPIVAPTDEKTPNTHAFFNIDWILVASQSRTDRNEDPTPGYNLIQLQAGWQRRFNDRCQVIVRLQAHNLLNRNYFNHLSRYRLIQLPEPGRNLQMVLTFQF
jgi:iron complex outermembrane receptor protein